MHCVYQLAHMSANVRRTVVTTHVQEVLGGKQRSWRAFPFWMIATRDMPCAKAGSSHLSLIGGILKDCSHIQISLNVQSRVIAIGCKRGKFQEVVVNHLSVHGRLNNTTGEFLLFTLGCPVYDYRGGWALMQPNSLFNLEYFILL